MAQMKVFVSHSHEDDAFCRALVDNLRSAGADVWYDEHNMGSGQLLDTIERELRERPVFVVVLSPAALKSQWVRNETKWAFQSLQHDPSRILLPVLATDIDEGDIWLFLQDFKRVEAPGIRPFPAAEAVIRTLHALQLNLPSEAPLAIAPLTDESAADLIKRGNALIAQSRFADACPLFLRVSELDQRSVPAWFGLGRAFQGLEDWQASLEAFERARSLDRNTTTIWIGITIAYAKLREPQMGEAAYARAVSLLATRLVQSLDSANLILQQKAASQVASLGFEEILADLSFGVLNSLQENVAEVNIRVDEATMNQSILQTVWLLDSVLEVYGRLLRAFGTLSEVLRASRRLDSHAPFGNEDVKSVVWQNLKDMEHYLVGEIERVGRVADENGVIKLGDSGHPPPMFLERAAYVQLKMVLTDGVEALSQNFAEVLR